MWSLTKTRMEKPASGVQKDYQCLVYPRFENSDVHHDERHYFFTKNFLLQRKCLPLPACKLQLGKAATNPPGMFTPPVML